MPAVTWMIYDHDKLKSGASRVGVSTGELVLPLILSPHPFRGARWGLLVCIVSLHHGKVAGLESLFMPNPTFTPLRALTMRGLAFTA